MIRMTRLKCTYCGGNVYEEDGDLSCILCSRAPKEVIARGEEKKSRR